MKTYLIRIIHIAKLSLNILINIFIKIRFFISSKKININTENGDIRLKVHNTIENKLFANHEENKLLNILSGKMNEEDVVYDVGAHAGYHSLYLASKTKEGQVFAFEPNPNCFEYLQENIKKLYISKILWKRKNKGYNRYKQQSINIEVDNIIYFTTNILYVA